ncbi:hypothetical protein L1987_01700 [Smallanthus sonchifolius]|uniref:Uncharacterized protein n=1 Tax=Smallanthus sonchifolius TaxID=185202 RepID=A0ACB9K5Z2_9ASTR|nr:hypothetical protein L1987_01700 [Smallanthus sonchifolius]
MRDENCKKNKVSWPKTLKRWFSVKSKAEDFHADEFSSRGIPVDQTEFMETQTNLASNCSQQECFSCTLCQSTRHGFALFTSRSRCICSSCSTALKFTEEKLGGC